MVRENMEEQQKTFEGWAVVELMGRNMIAGYVSEQVIAGATMLRVDVPATATLPPFTKFVGGSAIYGITPTTQEIAERQARALEVRPFQEWAGGDGRIAFSVGRIEFSGDHIPMLRFGGQSADEASEPDGIEMDDDEDLDDEDGAEEEEDETSPTF
jgi:hypothetical protein